MGNRNFAFKLLICGDDHLKCGIEDLGLGIWIVKLSVESGICSITYANVVNYLYIEVIFPSNYSGTKYK